MEDWECDAMKRIGTASGRLKPQDFSSSAHTSADVARVRTSEVCDDHTHTVARARTHSNSVLARQFYIRMFHVEIWSVSLPGCLAACRRWQVGFVGTWLGARTDPALMAAPHKTAPEWVKAERPFRWYHRIEERAAELVSLSNDEQEPVQIVKYGAGQK